MGDYARYNGVKIMENQEKAIFFFKRSLRWTLSGIIVGGVIGFVASNFANNSTITTYDSDYIDPRCPRIVVANDGSRYSITNTSEMLDDAFRKGYQLAYDDPQTPKGITSCHNRPLTLLEKEKLSTKQTWTYISVGSLLSAIMVGAIPSICCIWFFWLTLLGQASDARRGGRASKHDVNVSFRGEE